MERTPPLVWLEGDDPFPPVENALGKDTDLSGLLAIGGQLTVERLEQAYARGIFPWYTEGQPVLWWAPDPRMVLKTADFKLSRSLAKTLRRFLATPGCEIRVDHAFGGVMAACAQANRRGQVGTWITPAIQAAYGQWHQAGRVHSFEVWMNKDLVGGLYGVNIGRMFFGESMFSRHTDASKWALAALVAACRRRGIEWIDCQQNTAHLSSLGAAEVPRAEFVDHLNRVSGLLPTCDWFYDHRDWALLGLDVPAALEVSAASAVPDARTS
jgi:leucyl/phenylalanyl-tRNA--protein transferase